MQGIRTVLAVAWTVALAGVVHAVCPGLDVLIEDEFDSLRSTWGEASALLRVEDGVLLVAPASGTDLWRKNTAGLYDDIDLCVTVTVVTGIDATEAKVGAMFWYQDVNNFYVFQIAPNRMASVWRRQRGKWLEQIGWQRMDAANEGDGGINELRVTTMGDQATFHINGSEFGTIMGSPPEPGQQIGIFAASPTAGKALFAFDALRVTGP